MRTESIRAHLSHRERTNQKQSVGGLTWSFYTAGSQTHPADHPDTRLHDGNDARRGERGPHCRRLDRTGEKTDHQGGGTERMEVTEKWNPVLQWGLNGFDEGAGVFRRRGEEHKTEQCTDGDKYYEWMSGIIGCGIIEQTKAMIFSKVHGSEIWGD